MPMRLLSYRGASTDFFCVFLLGLSVLLLFLVVPPFHRGFFCDDESIRYPVPRTQTVSDTVVAVVSLCVPVVVMMLTETVRAGPSVPTSLVFCGWTPHVWMVQSYKHVGVFLFGAGVQQNIVEISKRMVGRLRPHFLAACLPLGVSCDSSYSYKYVTDYECSGDPAVVYEARMSFPSGHASLSFYAATFLCLYLQSKVSCSQSKLFKHLLQFLCVTLAWVTALTRVSDYMHHWSDVLAGGLIGSLMGLLTAITWCRRQAVPDNSELLTLVKRASPDSSDLC